MEATREWVNTQVEVEPEFTPLVMLIKADDLKNASRPESSSLESSFLPANNTLRFQEPEKCRYLGPKE